jgi:hypothetical protein
MAAAALAAAPVLPSRWPANGAVWRGLALELLVLLLLAPLRHVRLVGACKAVP